MNFAGLILWIGISMLISNANADFPTPTTNFQYSAVLIPDELAILWTVTPDRILVLEVHSTTKNWLGLGFSLDETQQDTDAFVYINSALKDGNSKLHFERKQRP